MTGWATTQGVTTGITANVVTTGARPVKAVVQEAVAELRERERKLARLVDELAEVRAAIEALEKIAGGPKPAEAPPEPPPEPPRVASTIPVGELREQVVLAAIKEHQPVSRGVLAHHTGLTLTQAKDTLLELRERGLVQKVGRAANTRYWLTDDLDRFAAEHNGMIPGEEPAA